MRFSYPLSVLSRFKLVLLVEVFFGGIAVVSEEKPLDASPGISPQKRLKI